MDAGKNEEDQPEGTLPYCGTVGALRALLVGLPENMPVDVLSYGDVVDDDPDDPHVLNGFPGPLRRFCVHEGEVILLVDEAERQYVADPLDTGPESGRPWRAIG